MYYKTGTRLLGPRRHGALWAGFAVDDCTDPSGDPIVVYDQFADRWILTQFTTRGLDDRPCRTTTASPSRPPATPPAPTTATRSHRLQLPRLPEVRRVVRLLRDHHAASSDRQSNYGIGVYGLEKCKMLAGDPDARAVGFFLDGNDPELLHLSATGCCRPTSTARTAPARIPAPMVGTQDDDCVYGAESDALNIWDLNVNWGAPASLARLRRPAARRSVRLDLPVRADLRVTACPSQASPTRAQFLDILSYRQRPTWRLAFRNYGTTSRWSPTSPSKPRPASAGMRWYEIRRTAAARTPSSSREPSRPPTACTAGWAASPRTSTGNMALGYSVVNGNERVPRHPLHRPAGQTTPAADGPAARGPSPTAPASQTSPTRAGATTRR